VERISFTSPASYHSGQNKTASFAGDQWAIIPRLTLSLGVRFDNDAITRSTHTALRAGFLLALSKNGSTLLKGGVGIFYDRVPLMIPTFPDLPDRTVTTLDQNGAGVSSVFYRNEISGPLRNPRSTSWNLDSIGSFCRDCGSASHTNSASLRMTSLYRRSPLETQEHLISPTAAVIRVRNSKRQFATSCISMC